MQAINLPTAELAATITRTASKQTYTTIRMLVPADRQGDALRAYAYFRWLDDLLDGDVLTPTDRAALLASQKELLNLCLDARAPEDLYAEEWLLVDLTQGKMAHDPGLRSYLYEMMAVMEFDTLRRGRRITRQELDGYSRRLAIAVTEAVYTFIGDDCRAPRTTERYLAADAAHIVHMLRDFHADLNAGYINIPIEIIEGEQIDPGELGTTAVRDWVRERVETAYEYFERGKDYFAAIENPRCRIAGAWYSARFEGVLAAIEREGYLLRSDYSDCKDSRAMLRMAWQGFTAAFVQPMPRPHIQSQPRPKHAAAWNRGLTSLESRKEVVGE